MKKKEYKFDMSIYAVVCHKQSIHVINHMHNIFYKFTYLPT